MKKIADRKVTTEDDELICTRRVEFQELKEDKEPDANFDNCLRLFGSHSNASLQLRARASIVPNGKERRMIATASFLDRSEVRALINRLTEIETTMMPTTANEPSKQYEVNIADAQHTEGTLTTYLTDEELIAQLPHLARLMTGLPPCSKVEVTSAHPNGEPYRLTAWSYFPRARNPTRRNSTRRPRLAETETERNAKREP